MSEAERDRAEGGATTTNDSADAPAPAPESAHDAHSAGAPAPDPAPVAPEVFGWTSLPPMRYQNGYVWFVLSSTLDVVLTWKILERPGGTEVNPVAALLIDHWGFMGAVGLKYALAMIVIVSCELIARRRERVGHVLIWVAVAISMVPPVWSFILLAMHGRGLPHH